MAQKKIYKCKSCEAEVELNTKKCPHCGVNNPAITNLQGCVSVIFICLIVGVLFYACSDDSHKEQAGEQAQAVQQAEGDQLIESYIPQYVVEYKITRSVDLSHATRTRFNSNILAPTALTKEQQIATAAQAAKDIQMKERVQVSSVNLFLKQNSSPKVTINYAPDHKGWSGEADSGNKFVIE